MKKQDEFLKEPVSRRHRKNVLDMAKLQMGSEKSFFEKYSWAMGVATTAVLAIGITISLYSPEQSADLHLIQFSSTFVVDDMDQINEFDEFELIEMLDELENWEEG
ncbi:hypothetical protein N9W41_00245 [bacterium]|nr:hypothetical protein [bacterium]